MVSDRLVWSSRPLINQAIAAGWQARIQSRRAHGRRAEHERRCARPLPPEGTREHRFAVQNRTRYAAELETARAEAAQATEAWARLEDRITDAVRAGDIPAALAAAADEAIWGPEEAMTP